MSVVLKCTLGTVNYTDWIHVTASKVSAPNTIVWEDWINVPVSNHVFEIPGLDPADYYVRYYDAPTDTDLGTLKVEFIVNAMTNEFQYERRFYTTGGPGTYDPAVGALIVTDPELIEKNVVGTFRIGYGYLDPADQYTYTQAAGSIAILYGPPLQLGEKFIVEIKYATGTVSSISGGLYMGTMTITESNKTLLTTDRNKRCRLLGTDSTQAIKLPPIESLNPDDGFYFSNTVGGAAIMPYLTFTTGKLKYNGFQVASNIFEEFWVGKGENVLIRKFDDEFFEIIDDYIGINVGERIAAGYNAHPNTLPENGQLIDGEEQRRLWWWLNSVLPSTSKYTDDTVGSGSWAPTAGREGQFAIHSTSKLFRMPKTGGYVDKGIADFLTYGGDTANRPVDAPGGTQADLIKSHGHRVNTGGDGTGADPGRSIIRQSYAGDGYGTSGTGVSGQGPYIEVVGGAENRVKNNGVVYLRRI